MLFLLLSGIIIVFFLQDYLFRHYWNHRLSVDINFSHNSAYEGEEAYLKEEITNRGFLPIPALEVQFAISRNLIFSGDAKVNSNITDQSYKRDIFSMMPNQKIIRRLSFQCQKRGFYEIPKSTVTGYNFFFHPARQEDHSHNTYFYVLPRPVDSRRIQLIYHQITGFIRQQNRLYPDPYEFSGIREYTPTDSMRHINWKASARSQKLLVNQFDSTTSSCVHIFLDTEDKNILKEENLVEESIRIAASLCSRIIAQHLTLHLHTVSGLEFSSCLETASITELNYEFARLQADQMISPVSTLLSSINDFQEASVYVLISKNQNEEIIKALTKLSHSGQQTLWILPFFSGSIPEIPRLNSVTIYPWEVHP